MSSPNMLTSNKLKPKGGFYEDMKTSDCFDQKKKHPTAVMWLLLIWGRHNSAIKFAYSSIYDLKKKIV